MRLQTGLALAAIPAAYAAAAFSVGNVTLGAVLTVVTVVLLIASAAEHLPILHQLEPHGGMTIRMREGAMRSVILCAGIKHDHRYPIKDVVTNVYVVGATRIARCTQSGNEYQGDGATLTGPDAPYWTQSGITIYPDSTVWWFLVQLPGPGDYPVHLTLNSPALYKREDERYIGSIKATY